MIVAESAWHVDFFGAFNTPLTRSVSLNFPEAPTFAKVALTRYENDLAGFSNTTNPWVSTGIMTVKMINKFPVNFPITKTGNGNVYVFFDANMINVVFGGTANNASGTFRWTLETWA